MAAAVDPTIFDKLGLSAPKKTNAKGSSELGQDAFLRLVLAQLENQDPLKPMENTDFLAQLAQMQAVSGIDEMKNSFQSLASTLQSNQALQASSLVGRFVLVDGDEGMLWPDIGMTTALEVPRSAEQVMVSIYNKAGELINQIELGAVQEGTEKFIWDGTDAYGNPVKPGFYKVEATAFTGGDSEALNVLVANPVESVTLNKGATGMTLNVSGVGEVTLSDVKEVM